MTLERFRYRTTDVEEAHAFIASSYTRYRPRHGGDGACEFSVSSAAGPDVAVDRIRGTLASRSRMAAGEQVSLATLVGERCVCDLGRRGEHRLAAGDSMLFPLGEELSLDWAGLDVFYVRLPLHEVRRTAGALTGLAPESVRFEPGPAVSRAAARQLAATQRFVGRELLDPAARTEDPLLLRPLLNLLVATMLATFPNSSLAAGRRAGGGRVAPATVRRAVAYIEENADRPITAADVAEAAGLGVRALQAAFQRHHDTTPLGHLRRVRLQLAHRDLQAADPARGDTVAAVATRWGWSRPDRFAAAYRAQFGVPPGRTLRG